MSRLKIARTVFLVLFILATLLCFWFVFLGWGRATSPSTNPTVTESPIIPIIASLSTSVVTLVGFVITTVLSFRREKREARDAELSRKQKEIELEKAQLELEQLKEQVKKKKK